MDDPLALFSKLIDIFSRTPGSVTLTVVGIFLLVLAGLATVQAIRTEPPRWLKVLLFGGLILGTLLAVVGPVRAVLGFVEAGIPTVERTKALQNLRENSRVTTLIRLIPHDANQQHLSVSNLKQLGSSDQQFAFVAPYEELRGLTVANAVRYVGGTDLTHNHRVSAIVFNIPSGANGRIYPANARGLLQVIRLVEKGGTPMEQPLLEGTSALSDDDRRDLDSTDIESWKFENYADRFVRYCELTQNFRCSKSRASPYSARRLIGDIANDWHPLGFSQVGWQEPCNIPAERYCAKMDWEGWRKRVLPTFGSRAFLIRNLALKDLPNVVLLEFTSPHSQLIPDIGFQ